MNPVFTVHYRLKPLWIDGKSLFACRGLQTAVKAEDCQSFGIFPGTHQGSHGLTSPPINPMSAGMAYRTGLVLLFHLFSPGPMKVLFDLECGNETFRRLAFRNQMSGKHPVTVSPAMAICEPMVLTAHPFPLPFPIP
jgi:hypothetical protein